MKKIVIPDCLDRSEKDGKLFLLSSKQKRKIVDDYRKNMKKIKMFDSS